MKDYGDYGLLACSFVTGMVDGASFLNWGVFVGMQTGEYFVLLISFGSGKRKMVVGLVDSCVCLVD